VARWVSFADAALEESPLYAPPALRARIIRHALSSVRTALSVYLHLPESSEATRLIPLLVERFGAGALRDALGPAELQDVDLADRQRWLREALG